MNVSTDLNNSHKNYLTINKQYTECLSVSKTHKKLYT